MKRYGLLGMILISLMMLISCASNNKIKLPANNSPIKETWIKQINLDPSNWLKKVDPWFLTGTPNFIEQNAPGVFTPEVRLIDVNRIVIQGNFQIQIVGGQEQNCVQIYGPKTETQQIYVNVQNNILYIGSTNVNPLEKVMVRIGIRNLRSLTNNANALVLGRGIVSDKLKITNNGPGSIFLVGKMNLRQVNNMGSGVITVIGAHTRQLIINVQGHGDVNVSGRVGVENINHLGNGCVNIIGADSNALCINAAGSGLTTVAGLVNLREVTAVDNSRVYINCARSRKLAVLEKNNAEVGIGGAVNMLDVNTADRACFLGEYLHGDTVYIKTSDSSHADVVANRRIFAESSGNSSIYFFGSNNILSSFPDQEGKIIVLGNSPPPLATVCPTLCASPVAPSHLFEKK